ncbi:MAG TPA: GHMP kinase [Candidatus Methylomirabilis sp.]|nr:GHMP kinase [Candidatus Methylomirabilis sp.]
MLIRARAPLRISFCGGGTDVPPYCDERGGVVLSATINRYATATVVPGGHSFTVRSIDYDQSVSYGVDDPFVYDGQLDLAKGVIDYFRRHEKLGDGLEVTLHNDAPPGSGLGSSSAITVALVSAIVELLRLPIDDYQVADLAYRIERLEVGIKGGKQDQYATTFGGFNLIEFHPGSTVLVVPLRLRPETIWELEHSLVFAYVGGGHFSDQIIENQVRNYETRRTDSIHAMDRLKVLTQDMKRALLVGDLREFGELLNLAWESKRQMAKGITNPRIDEVYGAAIEAGALGGKMSGAGGGGFMLFVCDPLRRYAVQEALRKAEGQLVNLTFVEPGVRTWKLK